jgi:transcriptional/translational regulatory protein YebC/TACO1
VAVLGEVLTDNRNRTVGEIRKIFELSDGKLGATNCVAWMFDNKGLFLVPAAAVDEEKLMEVALDAGADDVKRVEDKFEITCDPAVYRDVGKAWADSGITPKQATSRGSEEHRDIKNRGRPKGAGAARRP